MNKLTARPGVFRYTLKAVCTIVGLMVSLLPSSFNVVLADDINPGVYPIDSAPNGLTYGEWIVKWSQWLSSISADRNPAVDIDGRNCNMNQEGPVWFLAGTFGGSADRVCNIPAGKSILFPIITAYCSYLTDNVKTEEELRQCAREGHEDAVMEANIDQRELKNLHSYRITSNASSFLIPKDNPFGSPAGETQAIVDGYFIFLEPLPRGKHQIYFSGSIVDNPTTGTQSYSTKVSYDLSVQ